MTDSERLDWLETDSDRLEDVRGYVNNNYDEHGDPVSVREAIDQMKKIHTKPNS